MYFDYKLQIYAIVAATLSLLSGEKDLANPVEDAKRSLDRANHSLDLAEKQFKQSEQSFNQAAAIAEDWQRRLARAMREIDRRILAVSQSRDSIISAEKSAVRLTNQVSGLHSRLKRAEDVQNAMNEKLLGTEIVLYDMKWSVFAEWNLKTNDFNTWAEMPKGIELTSAELNSVFQGKPAIPRWNRVELISGCLGSTLERQCDFEFLLKKHYRDAAATDRVYVSTRGLAELLAAGHVADSRTKDVLPGASTIEGSAVELASGCLRELNAVHAFLRDAAPDEAERLLAEVAETIMSGKGFKSSKVEIVPLQASTNNTLKPAGGTELLRYLPTLRIKDDQAAPKGSASLPGFAVLVKNSPARRLSFDELRAKCGNAEHLSAGLLKRTLPGRTLRLFELAIGEEAGTRNILSPETAKMFEAADCSGLKSSPLDPSFADLRETAIGAEIKTKLAKLKIGGQGEVKLSSFTVNLQTGQVSMVADLRAKDRATLAEALSLVGKKVDDLAGDVIADWKGASTEVTKLRSELTETTRRLGLAANAASKAVGVLDFAQRDLDASRKQLEGVRRSVANAVGAKNEAQRHMKAASGRVKDAEREVIDLARLLNQIPAPLLARRPLWRL